MTGSAPEFKLEDDRSFTDVTVSLIIDHKTEVQTKFEGTFMVIAQTNKALGFRSELDFNEPEIRLNGKMVGVYSDVFSSDIIDLAEIHATGIISPEAKVENLVLSAFGIVGRGSCYENEELFEELATQVLNSEDSIIELESESTTEMGLIKTDECLTGHFEFVPHDQYSGQNYYSGVLPFTDIQSVLGVLMSLAQNDKVQGMLSSVHFPHGLNMKYTYNEALQNEPVHLMGKA